ncbi:MAG: hypothetical protein AAFV80_03335 [Bacteroidota bacterium]
MKEQKDPFLEVDAILNCLNDYPELQTNPDFWPNLEQQIHQKAPDDLHSRQWLWVLLLGLTLVLNLISMQYLSRKDSNSRFLQNSSTELSENHLFEQKPDWMDYLLRD